MMAPGPGFPVVLREYPSVSVFEVYYLSFYFTYSKYDFAYSKHGLTTIATTLFTFGAFHGTKLGCTMFLEPPIIPI
jgi:hypothetical protein